MTLPPDPTNPKPETKAALLARIRAARAALELALARLDEAALTTPGPDGWTIQDHLFHLSAWLRKTTAVLHGRPGHEALGVPQALYERGDEDGINARLQQQSQLLRLSDVFKVFRASHTDMLAYIESQPEAWLTSPYNPADAEDDRRVLDAIASNSYEHDEQHLQWIERQRA